MNLDALYIAARRTLLDVLGALAPHTDAVIVVGAHAVYLRTGDAGIPIAPFTTDADLALDPSVLARLPSLETLLEAAGFHRDPRQPGAWFAAGSTDEGAPIPIDIMVPSAVTPPGTRRSVALPGHDKMAMRSASGLEAVLVDNDILEVRALDPADRRSIRARIAGPTALIVAKLYKLHDRLKAGGEHRLADKDAGDIYRLMQATDTAVFIDTTRRLLRTEVSSDSTRLALKYLDELFGARVRPGLVMAVDALTPAVPRERIEGVTAAFMNAVRGAELTQ